WPLLSTATHLLVRGHATPRRLPVVISCTPLGVPGLLGLKVSSLRLSKATHRPFDGHATPRNRSLWSMATGAVIPGAMGLNGTSCPALSTPVHWFVDGQAIARTLSPPASSTCGVGVPGAAGSNVSSRP